MEDNSNEILTLLAKDELASDLFRLSHNKDRYLPPPEWESDCSRQSTPSYTGDEESLPPRSSLKLTFNKMPKRVELGYTFGRDSSKCDVFLPAKYMSGVHFHLTFSHDGQLLLIDRSTHGTWVLINGQSSAHPRHHFPWILSSDLNSFEVSFGSNHSPRFEIKIPNHTNIQAYRDNLAVFQKLSRDAGPSLGPLALFSRSPTEQPSCAMSPKRRPWYWKEVEIGRGGAGTVYKARDMSTNRLYAIKEFRPPSADNPLHFRNWRREIGIMRDLPHHPHIVHFVDEYDDIAPVLVMEYLPRGNLIDEQRNGGMFSMKECVLLLRQGLQALVHLHAHGYTHRDIKPANILVLSRTPFHIKLADFGLSKSSSELLSFCGTLGYVAPDVARSVRDGEEYTSAIDVWALGVVIFQMLYEEAEEPHSKRRRLSVGGVISDANEIIAAANDFESDELTGLLCTAMLTDHRRRLSAEECLQRATQLSMETFSLRVTQHQAKDSESSTVIQRSLRRSRDATNDSENKPRADGLPNYDPSTVRFKPSAGDVLRESMYQLRSIAKPMGPAVIKPDQIEMEVEGIMISMRRSDNSLNAAGFFSLLNRKTCHVYSLTDFQSSREFKQKNPKASSEAESWLPLEYAESICASHDLETVLKPLLDYGNGYIASHFGANIVMICHNRMEGLLINVTHLSKLANASRLPPPQLKTRLTVKSGDVRYHGGYCTESEALSFCRSRNLFKVLLGLRTTLRDHANGQIWVRER